MPAWAKSAVPFRPWLAAAESGGGARPSGPAVSPPALLEPLLRQPVAVFGGGVSGQAVRGLLGCLGVRSEIFDQNAEAGDAQDFDRAQAGEHRLVVFSPGFPPNHAWLQAARAAGCACLGELDFASLFWRGRIVAITGTNGKTTLTEFLTHALGAAGETAFAVGNVGFPFSRLPLRTSAVEAIAVCEVSSFQAETLRHFRADATLWTNFAENHLERHAGMKDYFSANGISLTTRGQAPCSPGAACSGLPASLAGGSRRKPGLPRRTRQTAVAADPIAAESALNTYNTASASVADSQVTIAANNATLQGAYNSMTPVEQKIAWSVSQAAQAYSNKVTTLNDDANNIISGIKNALPPITVQIVPELAVLADNTQAQYLISVSNTAQAQLTALTSLEWL